MLVVQQERAAVGQRLQHSNALQKTELFQDAGEAAVSAVISKMDYRQFAAGTNIVTQGEAASWLAVIMSGTATVYHDGVEVRWFGSLDVIGEGALVSEGHTRGATVRATTAVGALVLSRERYRQLLEDGTISAETDDRARQASLRYLAEDATRLARTAAARGGGRKAADGDGDGSSSSDSDGTDKGDNRVLVDIAPPPRAPDPADDFSLESL